MKIAITGANGFLGGHLIASCLQAGHDVSALVRSGANTSHFPDSAKLNIVTVNYKDDAALNRQLKDHVSNFGEWDVLIHNAGLTVSAFEQEYFDINVGLTRKLIHGLKESQALAPNGKLVYISSYAAVGPSHTGKPVSAYGNSKKESEEVICNSGYEFLICRPTGIYGSGDMAFLPLFQTAKYGFFPMMAPRKQKLTLIHGRDLAMGVVKYLTSEERYMHFNDGHVYSHEDFKKAISEATNKKLRNLSIPISLVKGWLKFSDKVHQMTHGRPSVTFEKYEEISMDWDLHETTDLYHPHLECQYDLTSGCQEAYDFYKKHKFV